MFQIDKVKHQKISWKQFWQLVADQPKITHLGVIEDVFIFVFDNLLAILFLISDGKDEHL